MIIGTSKIPYCVKGNGNYKMYVITDLVINKLKVSIPFFFFLRTDIKKMADLGRTNYFEYISVLLKWKEDEARLRRILKVKLKHFEFIWQDNPITWH